MAKKKKKRISGWRVVGTGLFIIFISIGTVILSRQLKPVVETPKSEVRKIPPEIKQQLTVVRAPVQVHVPILMYHYIEYVQDTRDTIRQSLNINPGIFESQVKELSEAGYTFMTAQELGEVINGTAELPSKPVLITIDDGHWDVDTDVLPILAKYDARATAYIIPGFTGGSDFLSTAQIQDLIKSGRVEIGAHTVHHISLKGKLSPVVTYEILESKKMIEERYGIPVVSFAYPNGAFDAQAIEAVKQAGFETAVSTVPGFAASDANRYFLYRIRPGRRTGKGFITWLENVTFRNP